MKSVLILILLLLSTSLLAGWKWEKLDIEVPYTYYLSNAVYDPALQKIVIVNASGNEDDPLIAYDTWVFDGEAFEHQCKTTYDEPFRCWMDTQGLVFDENLNKLTLYQSCFETGAPLGKSAILTQDDNLCWKVFKYGGTPLTSYDTDRNRAVSFEWGDYLIIEFDGNQFYEFPQSIRFDSDGSVTYDPNLKKTVYVGRTSHSYFIETLEWDGNTIQKMDAPYPDGVDQLSGANIRYNPAVKGIVGLIMWQATLIYKNQKWEKIIGSESPWNGPMVYYPVNGKFYLFSFDTVYTLKRTHSRPFDKP